MSDHEMLLRRLYRASAAYFLAHDIGIPEALLSRRRIGIEMLSALADVQLEIGETWIGSNQDVPPGKLALLQEYSPQLDCFRVGDLELGRPGFTLTVNGRSCRLSQTEYSIVGFLMSHPNRIITHEEIERMVWGERLSENGKAYDSLRVHILNIRKKIEPNPHEPTYLITIRGHGYMMHTKEAE